MARPKAKEPKQQFTVMLKPSIVKEIDKLADKIEISRSQLMANLIEIGLDNARVLNAIGMVDIIKIGGKVAAKLMRTELRKSEDSDHLLAE